MEWVERIQGRWQSSKDYDAMKHGVTGKRADSFLNFARHAEKDIAKLIAAVKVAKTALWIAEYSEYDEDNNNFICPVCGSDQLGGHEDGCALNQALAQLQSGEFGEGE